MTDHVLPVRLWNFVKVQAASVGILWTTLLCIAYIFNLGQFSEIGVSLQPVFGLFDLAANASSVVIPSSFLLLLFIAIYVLIGRVAEAHQGAKVDIISPRSVAVSRIVLTCFYLFLILFTVALFSTSIKAMANVIAMAALAGALGLVAALTQLRFLDRPEIDVTMTLLMLLAVSSVAGIAYFAGAEDISRKKRDYLQSNFIFETDGKRAPVAILVSSPKNMILFDGNKTFLIPEDEFSRLIVVERPKSYKLTPIDTFFSWLRGLLGTSAAAYRKTS